VAFPIASQVGGVGLIVAAVALAAQAEASSAEEIAAAAAGHDIVLLGEVHDNPAHHVLQAEVSAMLGASAFVFEMLDADAARSITPDSTADSSALALDLNWAESGWPDFAFYAPLFQQAAETAVYGAQIDRAAAQNAFASSAADVFGAEAESFGLTTPLPEDEQAAREAAQLAAHCDMLPPDILPGFVEAQRLRDADLARQALQALEDTGGPVVIITGNGHARLDWGVPAVLSVAAPEVSLFSLGQMEGELPETGPFDLLVTAAPVDRPDPCAAFR
jgi:uncharacterized iron-regulated protein